MKSNIFGKAKKQGQPSVDSSQAYQQQTLSPDPRANAPAPYPGQSLPPQHDPQSHNQPARSPSQRRTSQQPHPDHQHHASLGYIPTQQQPAQIPDDPSQAQRQQFRHSAYIQTPNSTHPQHQPEEKRGLRDRLGLRSSKPSGGDQSGAGLNRKLSVRGKHSPNPNKYPESESQPPQWARQNNSSQILLSPAPAEEDEDSHHNHQGQFPNQALSRPPVPLKDTQPDQVYTIPPGQAGQPSQPGQPRDYYPPPGSVQHIQYRPHGSSEQVFLTPEQQAQLQQQGHFVHHFAEQVQQSPAQPFQHYPPPAPSSAQVHPIGPPPGYVFPTEQQAQPAIHSLQQPSPEDGPGQFQAQVQQPDEQQLPQQLEIHQPQATRPHNLSENLYLQAPPAGSNQGNGPPSPFPQGNPAPDLSSAAAAPQQPPSPSSTRNSAPSPMPPPSRSGAGAVRHMDAKNMHSSSRESSMTAQHPPGPDSQSSGHPSYPANVVPTGSQGQPFRGHPGQQDMDHQRSMQPDKNPAEMNDIELMVLVNQMTKDQKELKEKYQKVKKYYFEKEAQVHQLQNTLANQRLSASRTSLDDSEYSSRFSRLDGLISQLAFNIRKSWVSIPQWLQAAVNKDAMVTGKQEMTAVGRAFISYWLYSHVFECMFHPDLEWSLSLSLKRISNNLRRYAPQCNSGEEEEALSSKLAAWRMATLEGLAEELRSPNAQRHRDEFVKRLNETLMDDISEHLTDPAPSDLAGAVTMIVELAANIVSHLPMESREVHIEYFSPFCPIAPDVMKLEQGIPQLTAPMGPLPGQTIDDDGDSTKETGTGASDAGSKDEDLGQPIPPPKDEAKGRGRNMLANLMGASGKPGVQGGAPPPKPGSAGSAVTGGQQPGQKSNGSGRETPGNSAGKEERVRMAVGLGVVIRNRSVLVRAPVFTTLV